MGVEATVIAYDVPGIVTQKNKNPLYLKKHIEKINDLYLTNAMLDDIGPLIREKYSVDYTIRVVDEAKYFQRPKILSNAIFGTVELWTVILYLNHMVSMEEFTRSKILLPKPSVAILMGRWYKENRRRIKK